MNTNVFANENHAFSLRVRIENNGAMHFNAYP